MSNPTPAALAALDELERLREATTFACPVRVEGGSDPMLRDDHGWWVAQVCSKSDVEMDDDGRANAAYIAALINAAPALLAAARQGEETRTNVVTAGDPVGVERCKACGEPFTAFETRISWVVGHWAFPLIGPIHERCQRFTSAQQDALDKVLDAARATSLSSTTENGQ